MDDGIISFLAHWTAAERAGDVDALGALLAEDFVGIGPLGFSLSKPDWIARHRQGLRYGAFDLEETQVRTYDQVAVVIAHHRQRGDFRGNPLPEVAAATHVLVRDAGSWRLGVVQLSFVAGTPGAPPVPGPEGRRTPMAPATQRPPGRRLQSAVFRVVNVPMRALLGLPVSTPLGRRLMLVHLTGRKTGKHYRQPVSYIRENGTLLTPGGGRWTANLRPGEPVHLRLRGRDVTARPELVVDPEAVERLLGVMAARNPALRRFVAIPETPDGGFDPDKLAAALRHGFCIVRWELAPPG